jgi:hypothetical protein
MSAHLCGEEELLASDAGFAHGLGDAGGVRV